MSRTHHRVTPGVARKRRALRGACKTIAQAWTFKRVHGRRGIWRTKTDRRHATWMVQSFRACLRDLEGPRWWAVVDDLRQWMPRRRRR